MDGDWVRLAGAVRAARKGRGFSQVELGRAAGVKRTVIQTIERGHTFQRVTGTLLSVERALGWGRGSIEKIVKGGDPLPSDEVVGGPGTPRYPLGPDLPFRIARTLSVGTPLDTAIVPLTPYADVVVVVQGKPNATREELLAALQAWERHEGYVDRLGEPAPGAPAEPPAGAAPALSGRAAEGGTSQSGSPENDPRLDRFDGLGGLGGLLAHQAVAAGPDVPGPERREPADALRSGAPGGGPEA